jgi:hypothetical protein
MNNERRGHSSTLETLTDLKAKIDKVLKDEWTDIPDDEKNWVLHERYLKSPQDIETRKDLIRKIDDKCGWIMELASQLKANEKTIRKYVNDPKLLDDKIERLAKGNGKVRVLDGIARQVFVEGVRLLSTTVDDLVKYIPQNYLHTRYPIFKNGNDRPVMERPVSRATYKNEARLCFDLTGKMTIKQMIADKRLMERVEKNLRNWEPGTVGVHAIQILWQVDHGEDQLSEDWVENTLLLMADRSIDKDRRIKFELFETGSTSEDKTHRVKKFIDKQPTRLVRLTSELREGDVKPTALDRSILEQVLGDEVKVEVDVPTRGFGMIKVPGKFPTQKHLREKLQSLLGVCRT